MAVSWSSELATVDELELLYLHLQSLHNVTDLANRARPEAGGAEATEAASGTKSAASTAPAKKARKKSSAKKATKGNGKGGN